MISFYDIMRKVTLSMPKRKLEILTESMFYVLMALIRRPMCGLEISAFVEQKTRGALRLGPATLYTILGKFDKEGYIREIEIEGRRRTYEITPRGENAYREELERLMRCIADARSEEMNAYSQLRPARLPGL